MNETEAINLIVLVSNVSAIARQEKIIKKPLGLKPTKQPKSIIDEFRGLPLEDVEFLKQVDKQFRLHGDQVQIKVERENTTKSKNKNTKRTIDGSLGYGYHQNQHDQGYYFSQPHVMHKFTMKDLPLRDKQGYREKATDIEIQQSHSFEIKEETYNQQNYHPTATQQSYQHEQTYEDPVPVIILRIPGPQKYALHLQALLQQYLEIRAAQYIRALEEQERGGQLHHPEHYVQQQQHQMQYIPMIAIGPMYHHPYYQQQQQHGYHQYYQTQVNHGHQQQQPQQHYSPGEQSYYRQHQQPAQHEYQTQEYHQAPVQAQQEYQHPAVQTQQEYPSSYINFVTPVYEQPEVQHQPQQVQHHEEHEQDDGLLTSENFPSDKHTHVIFKKKKKIHRPSVAYHQPEPIVVPDVQHHEEVHHHHHEQPQPEVHDNYQYSVTHQEHQIEPDVVTVTQRSKAPFNYHVAHATLAPSSAELHERHNPKRMAPFSKEHFEKARRMMVQKSKRNRGSTKQEKSVPERKAVRS